MDNEKNIFLLAKDYVKNQWEYYKTGPGYNDYIKPVINGVNKINDYIRNKELEFKFKHDYRFNPNYEKDPNSTPFPLYTPITRPIRPKTALQGGALEQQDVQQQIIQLVQAAMQGDLEALQTIEQIMQAAQQGDLQAAQIAQMIQQVAQQMQGVQAARHGAKLNYIRSLRGKCPIGYEVEYYKKGGQVCKTCVKKQQQGDAVEQYKCGKKMKKMSGGDPMPKPTKNTKVEVYNDVEADGEAGNINVKRGRIINGTDTTYYTEYPNFPEANRWISNQSLNRRLYKSEERDFENAKKKKNSK